ncbi:calcium/sodium antiporter [Enterobacillus tribolii]|uniref:Cation:H+ antiporter n=1 Tax=Enterobacillus tribolii TaxID=1487935 RepID=A0A370QQF1_9GAMM|nr:calcium/sodium antiporter [Enterobacillus tribolii]MBW7981634.1 calcium/sodium antiporter [Enterobacillus tribolii]RDK91013.1 cation:H+ antiporter [Enterobacillus tribolii]
MLLATMLLIIGLVLLVYGADRLVYGAAAIARSSGVSPMTIGMTIVGVGTSLPELTVATTAAMNYQPDTAIGTVLGSNIANILLILGCTALIRPLSVRSDILKRELPLMLAATVLCGLVLYDSQLTFLNGVLLLAAFAGFIWLMLKIARQATHETGRDPLTDEQMAELPADTSTTVAVLWMALGLIMLPLAARIVTDNGIVVARYFGVSELAIGLTIIAVGTSLPELATSIAGAIKGEHDMVLGNIIGSNICNILLVLGIPALFFPGGAIDPSAFARDYWVMLGVSIVLCVLCMRRRHSIGHTAGALLVCGFIAYVALLFSQHAAEFIQ